MCGIVGMVGGDLSLLDIMNQVQTHRGPNDSGTYVDREAGLGLAMRRLSIIDIHGGHQPMPNHDQSLHIVFNGEIYNSPELRDQLSKKGFVLKTKNSDTEALLGLYEERQEDMLKQLNGMFAFVIYDKKRKILFGARDRFGIKPFYFFHKSNVFAFASELKSLLVLNTSGPEINSQSLFHYLSLGYVPGGETIFSGIHRLGPGECFRFDLAKNEFHSWRYWDLIFPNDGPNDLEGCRRFIRHELAAAVNRWSLSDVPVACSLSGGLDSSGIVALLSQQSSRPIKTYSLGFSDKGAGSLDELPLARQMADKYKTDHHELMLEPNDVLNDLLEMVWHLDEPYGGGLPSWYVFKFMAKDVRVGFTGTGGDELFGDYGKFIPLEGNRWERFLGFGRRGFEPARFDHWYMKTSYYMADSTKRQDVFLSAAKLQNTGDTLKNIILNAPKMDLRNACAYLDFRTQLPEEFLFMTDRFSMAHSLEARVPFLDHIFVEKILSIPSSIRTSSRDFKYLLRESIQDLLPPDLITAKKKGFVLPTALWLRKELNSLARRLLNPVRIKKQGLFQPQYYQNLLEEHESGRKDHHKSLWFALMFQLWYSVFIENKNSQKPTWTWRDLN